MSTTIQTHICPQCGSDQVRWSKRRGALEHVAAVVIGRPMRCRDCRKRFYRWRERSAARWYRKAAAGSMFTASNLRL